MKEQSRSAAKRAARIVAGPWCIREMTADALGMKAKRDAERRAEALRRDTLDRLVGMTFGLLDAWKVGMDGGGEKEYGLGRVREKVSFVPLDVKGQEKRLAALRLGALRKAQAELNATLSARARGQCFYDDVVACGNALQEAMEEELDRYELATADELERDTALARCVAYGLFQCFNDWGNVEVGRGREPGKAFRNFVSRFRAFADGIIPEGSPLCQPLSNAYARTRERVLGHPGEEFWRIADEGTPMEGWGK